MTTVSELFNDPNLGRTVPDLPGRWSGEDGGAPMGPPARARATVPDTDGDDKWAAAVTSWDRMRADIRRLDPGAQAAAWRLAHAAMVELRADLAQQFPAFGRRKGEPR